MKVLLSFVHAKYNNNIAAIASHVPLATMVQCTSTFMDLCYVFQRNAQAIPWTPPYLYHRRCSPVDFLTTPACSLSLSYFECLTRVPQLPMLINHTFKAYQSRERALAQLFAGRNWPHYDADFYKKGYSLATQVISLESRWRKRAWWRGNVHQGRGRWIGCQWAHNTREEPRWGAFGQCWAWKWTSLFHRLGWQLHQVFWNSMSSVYCIYTDYIPLVATS